jgi:hypothetical protein
MEENGVENCQNIQAVAPLWTIFGRMATGHRVLRTLRGSFDIETGLDVGPAKSRFDLV